MKGMALSNSPETQPAAFEETVFFKGFLSICRTGRMKTTAGREYRRNEIPVKADY
jgi:hypothetical protein